MEKIIVAATGGTIASRSNPETRKLSSGVITGDELLGLIPDLDRRLPVEVHNLFGVPSSFLGPDRMLTLARRVQSFLESPEVAGVVVTHGTDTLEESAYLAGLVISGEKPVVFTGSQRGPLETGSDGLRNLRDAIRVAAWEESRSKGVLVVFNEEIHSAIHVIKTDAYKLEAFRSEGKGPLGFIDDEIIRYHADPVLAPPIPVESIDARVELIKVVAGMDGGPVDSAVDRKADGLVIEGFGRGHVPPEMMPSIRRAVAQGVVVLVVSRCGRGFVREVYDFEGSLRDLLAHGAISGPGMPGTKARIKLLLVLSHTRDSEIIGSFFDRDR